MSCVHAGSYKFRANVAPNPTSAVIAQCQAAMKGAGRIICLGGGSVIDVGKHIADGREIVAVPCNFSGAEATGYATFYHQGQKHSAETPRPSTVVLNATYLRGASPEALARSWCDAYCHAVESGWNKNAAPDPSNMSNLAREALMSSTQFSVNTLWGAHLAGRAIDIAPTGLPHALSYPMVGKYGMYHGDALACVLWRVARYNGYGNEHARVCKDLGMSIDWPDGIDVDVVLDAALVNPRAENNPRPIHREELRQCLVQS